MTNIWEKFKSWWAGLLWLVAAVVVMIDPKHIYEWAHQHELLGGLITALWAILVAWATRQRGQQGTPGVLPPGTPQSPIVPQGPVQAQGSKQWKQP